MQVPGVGTKPRGGGQIKGNDKFVEICKEIGRQLANRKHQVYLLSDKDSHADVHIFSGYAEELDNKKIKAPPILVSYGNKDDPENNEGIKFHNLRQKYKDVLINDFNASADYPFNRVSIIKQIDALIVIGGSDGTKQLIEIATSLDKPIIPISAFGQVAERTWNSMELYFRRVLQNQTEPLTKYYGDTSSLRVNGVLDIVEKMVRVQNKETSFSYKFLILVECVALVLWFIVFQSGSKYSQIAMPVLIFMMAILGIILRSLIRLLKDPDQFIQAKVFFVEIGLALGLSVIYYFFFQLGGSSISTDFESILKDRTFNSVALIVSLLTVGVSFLLEETIEKASKRLSRVTDLK